MGNSIYLGGGIKSAFCGGNVKEIWQGTDKLFPSGGGGDVIHIGAYDYGFVRIGNLFWTTENFKEDIVGSEQNPNYPNVGRFYPTSLNQTIISILPSGWRIPSIEDLNNLVSNSAGKNLIDESAGGTNETKFSALCVGGWQNFRGQWAEQNCSSFGTNVSSSYIQRLYTNGAFNPVEIGTGKRSLRFCSNVE